jgi:hypothetical protein
MLPLNAGGHEACWVLHYGNFYLLLIAVKSSKKELAGT